MSKLNLNTIENGIFVPRGLISKHNLVYDSKYNLITESCLLRGIDKTSNVSSAPDVLPKSLRKRVLKESHNLLFLGHFMERHYGHFLTEGLSRYWYLFEHDIHNYKIAERKNPFGAEEFVRRILNPSQSHWFRALHAINLQHQNFISSSKPLQASKIIIPEPSWYERWKMDPAHLRTTRKLGQLIAGTDAVPQINTPVYLSRTKLKKSNFKYLHEPDIENYCREIGCKIVHPEQLSIQEQVMLFNQHDVFIGCEGSAFHSVLFRFVDRTPCHIYLARQGPVPNFEIIDKLMNNQSHYIRCYYREAKSSVLDCNKIDVIKSIKKALNSL